METSRRHDDECELLEDFGPRPSRRSATFDDEEGGDHVKRPSTTTNIRQRPNLLTDLPKNISFRSISLSASASSSRAASTTSSTAATLAAVAAVVSMDSYDDRDRDNGLMTGRESENSVSDHDHEDDRSFGTRSSVDDSSLSDSVTSYEYYDEDTTVSRSLSRRRARAASPSPTGGGPPGGRGRGGDGEGGSRFAAGTEVAPSADPVVAASATSSSALVSPRDATTFRPTPTSMTRTDALNVLLCVGGGDGDGEDVVATPTTTAAADDPTDDNDEGSPGNRVQSNVDTTAGGDGGGAAGRGGGRCHHRVCGDDVDDDDDEDGVLCTGHVPCDGDGDSHSGGTARDVALLEEKWLLEEEEAEAEEEREDYHRASRDIGSVEMMGTEEEAKLEVVDAVPPTPPSDPAPPEGAPEIEEDSSTTMMPSDRGSRPEEGAEEITGRDDVDDDDDDEEITTNPPPPPLVDGIGVVEDCWRVVSGVAGMHGGIHEQPSSAVSSRDHEEAVQVEGGDDAEEGEGTGNTFEGSTTSDHRLRSRQEDGEDQDDASSAGDEEALATGRRSVEVNAPEVEEEKPQSPGGGGEVASTEGGGFNASSIIMADDDLLRSEDAGPSSRAPPSPKFPVPLDATDEATLAVSDRSDAGGYDDDDDDDSVGCDPIVGVVASAPPPPPSSTSPPLGATAINASSPPPSDDDVGGGGESESARERDEGGDDDAALPVETANTPPPSNTPATPPPPSPRPGPPRGDRLQQRIEQYDVVARRSSSSSGICDDGGEGGDEPSSADSPLSARCGCNHAVNEEETEMTTTGQQPARRTDAGNQDEGHDEGQDGTTSDDDDRHRRRRLHRSEDDVTERGTAFASMREAIAFWSETLPPRPRRTHAEEESEPTEKVAMTEVEVDPTPSPSGAEVPVGEESSRDGKKNVVEDDHHGGVIIISACRRSSSPSRGSEVEDEVGSSSDPIPPRPETSMETTRLPSPLSLRPPSSHESSCDHHRAPSESSVSSCDDSGKSSSSSSHVSSSHRRSPPSPPPTHPPKNVEAWTERNPLPGSSSWCSSSPSRRRTPVSTGGNVERAGAGDRSSSMPDLFVIANWPPSTLTATAPVGQVVTSSSSSDYPMNKKRALSAEAILNIERVPHDDLLLDGGMSRERRESLREYWRRMHREASVGCSTTTPQTPYVGSGAVANVGDAPVVGGVQGSDLGIVRGVGVTVTAAAAPPIVRGGGASSSSSSSSGGSSLGRINEGENVHEEGGGAVVVDVPSSSPPSAASSLDITPAALGRGPSHGTTTETEHPPSVRDSDPSKTNNGTEVGKDDCIRPEHEHLVTSIDDSTMTGAVVVHPRRQPHASELCHPTTTTSPDDTQPVPSDDPSYRRWRSVAADARTEDVIGAAKDTSTSVEEESAGLFERKMLAKAAKHMDVHNARREDDDLSLIQPFPDTDSVGMVERGRDHEASSKEQDSAAAPTSSSWLSALLQSTVHALTSSSCSSSSSTNANTARSCGGGVDSTGTARAASPSQHRGSGRDDGSVVNDSPFFGTESASSSSSSSSWGSDDARHDASLDDSSCDGGSSSSGVDDIESPSSRVPSDDSSASSVDTGDIINAAVPEGSYGYSTLNPPSFPRQSDDLSASGVDTGGIDAARSPRASCGSSSTALDTPVFPASSHAAGDASSTEEESNNRKHPRGQHAGTDVFRNAFDHLYPSRPKQKYTSSRSNPRSEKSATSPKWSPHRGGRPPKGPEVVGWSSVTAGTDDVTKNVHSKVQNRTDDIYLEEGISRLDNIDISTHCSGGTFSYSDVGDESSTGGSSLPGGRSEAAHHRRSFSTWVRNKMRGKGKDEEHQLYILVPRWMTKWVEEHPDRCKVLFVTLFVFPLILVACVAVGLAAATTAAGSQSSSYGANTPSSTTREDYVRKELIMEELRPVVGEDDTSRVRGEKAYKRRALDWIVTSDPMRLDFTSDNLVQRYILAMLYFATNGEGWTNCGGGGDGGTTSMCVQSDGTATHPFLSEAHECQWYGIKCDDTQRVAVINLRENNLSGELPTEISRLSSLRHLVLSKNSIRGSIPNTMGVSSDMTNLMTLYLNKNLLTGTIPPNLGRLPRLTAISLGDNDLGGYLPKQLFQSDGRVCSLTHVDFGGNSLVGNVPDTMFNCRRLQKVNLEDNSFSGSISTGFGSLPKLELLMLGGNGLTGGLAGEVFPVQSRLRYLDVSANGLDGPLPTELFKNGQSLKHLNLASNRFVGTVPSAMASLGKLEFVNVTYNYLGGAMPNEVCSLRGFSLRSISADCRGDANFIPPRMECRCCTECVTGYNEIP